MNRSHLFFLKKKHKNKPPAEARENVRRELLDYFRSPEGQEELKRAPRVTVEFEPNYPLQDQSVERVVDLLMQELDNDESEAIPGKN